MAKTVPVVYHPDYPNTKYEIMGVTFLHGELCFLLWPLGSRQRLRAYIEVSKFVELQYVVEEVVK